MKKRKRHCFKCEFSGMADPFTPSVYCKVPVRVEGRLGQGYDYKMSGYKYPYSPSDCPYDKVVYAKWEVEE